MTCLRAVFLLITAMLSLPVLAQEVSKGQPVNKIGGILGEIAAMDPLMLTLIGMVMVLIIAIMFLLMYLAALMNYIWLDRKRAEARASGAEFRPETIWSKIRESFISGKLYHPEEERKIMLLDHDYDGIQEMDYGMPPWLKTFFIVTILFSVYYLMSMYVFDGIKGSIQEYDMAMEEAKMEQEARLTQLANAIDENSVEASDDKTLLLSGKSIFTKECKACHGANGEGGVGPNLTDDYWLHGGSIKHIFKTIKYGVPEKGMISWQKKLRPMDMSAVANYIRTLHGTSPANAKAPEGELYQSEMNVEAASDSTQQAIILNP